MKLFLDANVLLDVLLARQPFVDDSERVLSLCAKKVFDGQAAPVNAVWTRLSRAIKKGL